MKENYKRNRYTFGIGTIGRDMSYTLISMYLMFYFTDVANITTADLFWVTGIMVVWRVVMQFLTRSWGFLLIIQNLVGGNISRGF